MIRGVGVGDGRFYTWSQFFIILFLTVFMIMISMSIVLCFFQEYRKKGLNIKLLYIFLGIGSCLRFAEEVFVSRELAFIAKYGELFFIILSIIFFLSITKKKSLVNRIAFQILSFFSVSILIVSLFNNTLFVKDYNLLGFSFGLGYLSLLSVWFLFSLLTLIGVKKGTLSFWCFFIPLSVHIIGILIGHQPGDLTLLLLYPAFLFAVNNLSRDVKAYIIGDQAFSNINNLINDAFLIIDPQDKIIFKNQDAIDADFLKNDADYLVDGNPETIFNEKILRENKFNIQTYTDKSGNRYLECRTKDILQRNRLKGRSLIISDITQHIKMLDIQAEQKESLEKINLKLNKYSNIVFDMEKEKEISSLLSNITKDQEKFMFEFREKIKELSALKDMEEFNLMVDLLIKEAKSNLSKIRAVVSRYRRYYGTAN